MHYTAKLKSSPRKILGHKYRCMFPFRWQEKSVLQWCDATPALSLQQRPLFTKTTEKRGLNQLIPEG